MPCEFEHVHVRAIQVGSSLTALVAEFHLSTSAMSSLDAVWHERHEPIIRPGPWGPAALDRHWSALWKVQSERKRLHDLSRNWMAEHVPGFFVRQKEEQPLLDMLLFDSWDVTRDFDDEDRASEVARSDALRALGVPSPHFEVIESDQLPGLSLAPSDPELHHGLGDSPSWGIYGSRRSALKQSGKEIGESSGREAERELARSVEDMYYLLVMLAVSEFLKVSEARYATIRDRSSVRHIKFNPRSLRELRADVLTLSMNLASLRRDVAEFWARDWRWHSDAEFFLRPTQRMMAFANREGREPREPRSFNEAVREDHTKRFDRLVDSDREHREILSTVASLGASVDSYRMGRAALWVAVASLVVALTTLFAADLTQESPIVEWARGLF